MAGALGLVSVGCALFFSSSVVKTNRKAKPSDIFSNSGPINNLSAARVFLFGARDMWFVVALPIFLYEQLNWGIFGSWEFPCLMGDWLRCGSELCANFHKKL